MGELVPTGPRRAGKAGAAAASGRPRRHARRPALHQGRRGELLRPAVPGQSADRDAGARRPNCRSTACASCASPTATVSGARSPTPVEPVRDASGRIEIKGTMQADHHGDRRLDPPISGAMAMAAPPLAVNNVRRRGSRRDCHVVLFDRRVRIDDAVLESIKLTINLTDNVARKRTEVEIKGRQQDDDAQPIADLFAAHSMIVCLKTRPAPRQARHDPMDDSPARPAGFSELLARTWRLELDLPSRRVRRCSRPA